MPPAAFDVFLEAPGDGADRISFKVTVAGMDKVDAARRARWAVARERGIRPTLVQVIGAYPAGTAAETIPAESPRRGAA